MNTPDTVVTHADHYVVNGQKIWSTIAHFADKCLLLTRTGNEGPPQAGLTYLLLDMRAEGGVVRPISQITGYQEFAEVFLDDVKVPVQDRIGGEGTQVVETLTAGIFVAPHQDIHRLHGNAGWALARQ